jgi:hypothetical protein
MLPKTRQRSMVSMSMDNPRSRSSGGARISALEKIAMARTKTASRNGRDTLIMRGGD